MADVLGKVLNKVFGSASGRYVKRSSQFVQRINELEPRLEKLTDEELKARSDELRAQLEERKRQTLPRPLKEMLAELQEVPEERRKTLKKRIIEGLNEAAASILPEAYALVREACKRNLANHRHFDVQMIGGKVLHEGKIAEMATGEGKTLVATLPVYINVLLGFKVHVVSVNDYLVKRDRDWMSPIYEALGLTAGAIQSSMDTTGPERKEQYACDVTYGTNNEFGFDYLRDNMKIFVEQQAQGPLHYAIIDEVDSILIDEARTPLIISGPAHDDVSRYKLANQVAKSLLSKQRDAVHQTQSRLKSINIDQLKQRAASLGQPESRAVEAVKKFQQDPTWLTEDEANVLGHVQYYVVERDRKSVHLTHEGVTAAQEQAGIGSFYVGSNMEWPHLIENALRAHVVYEKDKDYVVQNGEVIIVDEFTGRLMIGRQWSDGLHQAVEAKENVQVKEETQTLATITIQNYFKLYCKLAGMTGTAMTESEEFLKIYNLDVLAIPTNRPVNRMDHNDRIYRSLQDKYGAIVDEIKSVHEQGFPNDPWLQADMLRALRKVYEKWPAKASRGLPVADKDHCQQIVGRIDKAIEAFDDGKGDREPLRELLVELTAELPGGRPILVGTTSIENNETLSKLLSKRYGIDHEVLNAKHHAREAEIVAKAGQRHASKRDPKRLEGNVTIATNMAGRGTDIKLQEGVVYRKCIGDLAPREPGVIATKCCIRCPEYDGVCSHCFKPKNDSRFPEMGRTFCRLSPPCGLHVVGTERHEARRIDNQLRGRSGRQGDPGSSRFFLSLQDELLKLFAGDWLLKVLDWLGMEEGMAIEDRRISKGIERAQRKVEERNFGIRKNLLEYDEVMDYQRQVLYRQRQRILEGRDLATMIWQMLDQTISEAVEKFLSAEYPLTCISEWVRSALDVQIRPDRLSLDNLDDLVMDIRRIATDEARDNIQMTLGEYLDPDIERRDWDYRGLAKWAMSRFNVNLQISRLQRMDVDQIAESLTQAAIERIEKFDFSPLEKFADPLYGKQQLVEWANTKFEMGLKLDEIESLNAEQTEQLVKERARQLYRRREIEYPVEFALDQAFGESTIDSAYGADALVRWVNSRYNADWQLEHLQGKKLPEIREELIRLSEGYYNGQLVAEVEQAVSQRRGEELKEWARQRFGPAVDVSRLEDEEDPREVLLDAGRQLLRTELTQLERFVLLQIYDAAWKDHLLTMDHLKSSIGLRGYAERDPKIEYKREGTQLFYQMMDTIRDRVTSVIFKARLTSSAQMRSVWQVQQAVHQETSALQEAQREAGLRPQGEAARPATIKRDKPKVRSNDPCPCGSGKKYKKCCGRSL